MKKKNVDNWVKKRQEHLAEMTPEIIFKGIRNNDISTLSSGITLVESHNPDHRLDANTLVDVTGQQLNTTTGTLGFKSSGSVQLTGNQVNIALGDEVSQVWRIVDTGTSVAYTEVSTGSSVTWNEIDTAA